MIVSDSFVIADWSDPGRDEPRAPDRRAAPAPLGRRGVVRAERAAGLPGRRGARSRFLAGGSILVLRGTPHSYWNAVAEPTRYLLVMTPRIHQLMRRSTPGSGPTGRRSSKSTTPSCLWSVDDPFRAARRHGRAPLHGRAHVRPAAARRAAARRRGRRGDRGAVRHRDQLPERRALRTRGDPGGLGAAAPLPPGLGVDVFETLSLVDGGDLQVTPGNALRTTEQIDARYARC